MDQPVRRYAGHRSMRIRATLTTGAAAMLAVALAFPAPAGAAGAHRHRAAKVRLASFHSCQALIRYGREHAAQGIGLGIDGPAVRTPAPTVEGAPQQQTAAPNAGAPAPATGAPTAGQDYSETNVQEQ